MCVCVQTYKHSSVIKLKFILLRLTLTFSSLSHSRNQESVQWKKLTFKLEKKHWAVRGFLSTRGGGGVIANSVNSSKKKAVPCVAILDLCSPNCM